MSLCAKDNRKEYVPPPACTTVARCYQVVDIGLQKTGFGHKNKVVIGWELPNQCMPDGKPFTISHPYYQSWGKNGTLRKHLETWRGRQFTSEELDVFDLRSLIGRACFISICHQRDNNGQTWANIAAVGPCPAEYPCPPAINPPLIFNLDDATEAEYQALPDFFKNKILWPQPPKASTVQPTTQAVPAAANPNAAAQAFYAAAAPTHTAAPIVQPGIASPNQPIPTFAPASEDASERVDYDEYMPF